MKKAQQFLILSALLLFGNSSWATIWRINNVPGIDADFTSLQAAHDDASVQAGDTLLVEGSTTNYGNLTANKPLVILGTGYFLAQNPETQANPSYSIAADITVNTSAAGLVISGMTFSKISIYASNTVVMRCHVYQTVLVSNASNVVITQNYLSSSGGITTIFLSGNCSNIMITNNYIQETYTLIASTSSSTAIVMNNVFNGQSASITLYNSIFENNILYKTYQANLYGCTVKNNLCSGTQLPSGNGNQLNVDMTTVFELSGSTDGQWKLKAGSPAIGAGVNGEDCGMFGGNNPYVLSGMPQIPAIYFYSAPVSGSALQGLPVHIKIKAHN